MQTDTVHKQLEQFIRAGLSFEEAVSALRNLDLDTASVAGLSGLKGASTRVPRHTSFAGRGRHARTGGIPTAMWGDHARTCLTSAPATARKSAAWVSLRATLIALGGVTVAAYVASLPWFLRAADAGIAGLTWFLLYKLVRGYRAVLAARAQEAK